MGFKVANFDKLLINVLSFDRNQIFLVVCFSKSYSIFLNFVNILTKFRFRIFNNINFDDCFDICLIFCHFVVAYLVILVNLAILAILANMAVLVDLVSLLILAILMNLANLVIVVDLMALVHLLILLILTILMNL